jgi:outer membrane protein assembly factor BamA
LQHPHPPVGARFSLLVLALLAFFLAVPAVAVAAATPVDATPRFPIEKISVKGNRRPASARIVVSESLLKEGRTYGEDELRTAIHRIKRLPFIIEADFSLQKGSERGRYDLVIAVEETRRIFVDLEGMGDYAERTVLSSPIFTSRRFDFSNNSLLGVREFVGSEGVVFASFGSPNGLFQLGYTRYNLFGPGSFASLAVAFTPDDDKEITTSLSAGVPLTVNQSLRATVASSQSSFRSDVSRDDSSQQSGQLDWLYNTTDDPLFPTRGDAVEAALEYRRFHSTFKNTGIDLPSFRFDERTWAFSLSGNRHRPLTARQSLTFGLSAAAYRFTEDRPSSVDFLGGSGRGYQASVNVAHAFDLWQGERSRHWGDLRLETSAAYVGSYSHDAFSTLFDQTRVYQLTLGETLVFRNPWAIVRLGILYHGKVMR